MSDTLSISDTDLEAMLSEVLPCDKCQGPAEYMSRGHRCRPPGYRSFKCHQCHTEWVAHMETILAVSPCRHKLCGAIIHSISDLSVYHKI